VLIDKETGDGLNREKGVLVTGHPSTILEDGFEEIILSRQLRLTCLTNPRLDSTPHIGDDNDILLFVLTTEISEHLEVSRQGPAHPVIRDPMKVEDNEEPVASSVSAYGR